MDIGDHQSGSKREKSGRLSDVVSRWKLFFHFTFPPGGAHAPSYCLLYETGKPRMTVSNGVTEGRAKTVKGVSRHSISPAHAILIRWFAGPPSGMGLLV
ncbi:hypothetical protein CPLU01_12873 [Colletotrichum plurivorum]|uniref:Uncharacterized protein n=1 Tax=Colletotrichum plurivorum TaxID=2175906 RepID=A0A8H6JVQ0_9PEZI|nr:hypothetical protein CPLU01_12873 [Colletotrichum plurivorum]